MKNGIVYEIREFEYVLHYECITSERMLKWAFTVQMLILTKTTVQELIILYYGPRIYCNEIICKGFFSQNKPGENLSYSVSYLLTTK